ncbi:MAG: SDR family NAD(P)-dependent oxidoreductase [Anaerolineaceae bacterium]|nr:SDR family NAD(P)-dependent oxidoreductase [Anaerolineaceae bacterium]
MTPPDNELAGRIAIITGAGRGIGLGVARALCAAGATCVIAELEYAAGEAAAQQLRDCGHSTWAQQCDVRSRESVDALVQGVLQRHGRVDILVNNAGMNLISPTESHADGDWQLQVDVMLNGVFICTRAVGAVMLRQGSGVILNISSIAGYGAWPLRAAYDAAKAGVISLTENIGCEWARRGVRVVSVAPGVTRTSILQSLVEQGVASLDQYERRTPMGRVAEVEEIASVARFLVSDRASYITATTIAVDGGWIAWDGLPAREAR